MLWEGGIHFVTHSQTRYIVLTTKWPICKRKLKKILYLLDFQFSEVKTIMDIGKSKFLNKTQQDSEDSNYEGMILDIFITHKIMFE